MMLRHADALYVLMLSMFLFPIITPTEFAALPAEAQTSDVPVVDDLVITQNVRLRPGTYTLNDAKQDGIIQIRADNITLDGTGVRLIGSNASGYGIQMNGHTGLTLRNFNISGFRYGVRIEDASRVLIENSNISGNKKDTTECFLNAADGDIYGGGIFFRRVRLSIVRNSLLTNQSTGVEMLDSHQNSIVNNRMSSGPEQNQTGQNSCWGVRLESSTENLIRSNIADYVDRRRYPKGTCEPDYDSCFGVQEDRLRSGDSAGILLVKRSDRNRIISNAVTHGGDGIFIGGTNNSNYVYGNDASYSPHNAVEGTFSEGNVYENNITSGSCYGFWLGYSSRSRITNNEINDIVLEGIAIEHGGYTEIDRNSILRGAGLGIHLWTNNDPPPSRDYNIHHNDISLNTTGIQMEDTSNSSIWQNQLRDNRDANVKILKAVNGSTGVAVAHNSLICSNTAAVPANLAYGKQASANVGGSTAAKAVDGNVINTTSTWSPGTVVVGSYWQVDLGAIRSISELIVYPWFNLNDFPYKFHIDVSTTGAFGGEQMRVVTEPQRPIRPELVYGFAPVSARYIRLVSDEERNWVQMLEFAAFAQRGQSPIKCHYSVYNGMSSGLNVSALGNWWGTTNVQSVTDAIHDRADDANLGSVFYNPFLLEPVPAPGGASGPPLGAWATTTALPQASAAPFLDRGQQLIFHNNRVYVFGGHGPNNTRLTTVYYSTVLPDGRLGPWTSTTPLPVQPYDHAVVRVGNRVYLITGAAGATAVYYAPINTNGSIGTWRATTPLNPSRQSFAAVAYGDYIYAAGGNSGGTKSFVKYTSVRADGTLTPWADTTPLPEPIQSHTMTVYHGLLHVLAPNGRVYYAPINTNGTVGAWRATTQLPQSMSNYSSFESGGYLYLLGGTSPTVFNAALRTDGTLGQWLSTTGLPEQISGLRASAYNGYVYALGGNNSGGFKNTVYYSQLNVPAGCQGGETVLVPFSGGPNASQASLAYAGLNTVTVSRVGQASRGEYSDAFYIFADRIGNPIPPRHPTEQYNWLLTINGQHAERLFYSGQRLPAYRPDHRYTFRINVPAGPLSFGVSDASTADNTGRYVIGLCGGTP